MFNEENVRDLTAALSAQQPFSKNRPINADAIADGCGLLLDYKRQKGANYEAFLASLQALLGISNPTQSDRDSYEFLFSCFYEAIHNILCFYQEASYEIIYGKNRRWFSKLENLLSDGETWVFSLNHDLYFEYLALDLNIPITYGDDHQVTFPISNIDVSRRITLSLARREDMTADHSGFFKNVKGVNLVKLHGGLSELEYKDNTLLCNLRLNKGSSRELADEFKLSNAMTYCGGKKFGGRDRIITNADGEPDVISKSMLTGGRKYSQTSKIKKGEEKLQLFDDVLRHLDELTILGYGFGDEHINFRVSNALLLNPDLRVIIVDPFRSTTPACIGQFDYDLRIKRAACGAAQWMDYSKSGSWNEDQMNGLKENERYRSQIRERVESRAAHLFRFRTR